MLFSYFISMHLYKIKKYISVHDKDSCRITALLNVSEMVVKRWPVNFEILCKSWWFIRIYFIYYFLIYYLSLLNSRLKGYFDSNIDRLSILPYRSHILAGLAGWLLLVWRWNKFVQFNFQLQFHICTNKLDLSTQWTTMHYGRLRWQF